MEKRGERTSFPRDLPPGTILRGRYQICGGLGRLYGLYDWIDYLGRDLERERDVVVWEFFVHFMSYRDVRKSLLVEPLRYPNRDDPYTYDQRFDAALKDATARERLSLPDRIGQVLDCFQENGTIYVVMPYFETGPLFLHVRQPIPLGMLLPLLEPIVSGLEQLHRSGRIHGNISPENLQIGPGGLYLVDPILGLRGHIHDPDGDWYRGRFWIPVELLRSNEDINEDIGSWSDVYPLSTMLYCYITGRRPGDIMDRLCDDPLVPPRQLGAELTGGQEQAILRGMEPHPKDRIQTMGELWTALLDGQEPWWRPEIR